MVLPLKQSRPTTEQVSALRLNLLTTAIETCRSRCFEKLRNGVAEVDIVIELLREEIEKRLQQEEKNKKLEEEISKLRRAVNNYEEATSRCVLEQMLFGRFSRRDE